MYLETPLIRAPRFKTRMGELWVADFIPVQGTDICVYFLTVLFIANIFPAQGFSLTLASRPMQTKHSLSIR
jgi:hypothetical protein